MTAPWREQDLAMVAKARQVEAARQIHEGRIRIPLACARCDSASVQAADPADHDNREVLACLQCGTFTTLATARRLRRQKIRRTIEDGVDLPLLKGSLR